MSTATQTTTIEVGYGREGVVTDALAKRIIEEVAKPFFKRAGTARPKRAPNPRS